MNSHFQSLFENVCRCFGHTPSNNGRRGDDGTLAATSLKNGDDDQDKSRMIAKVNSQASSVTGKRRTDQLELNDKQYDGLFVKDKKQHERLSTVGHDNVGNSRSSTTNTTSFSRAGQQQQPTNKSSSITTTCNNALSSCGGNPETAAEAVAQAKIAANPPRYRSKRKRSSKTREEIFRNIPNNNEINSSKGGGASSSSSNNHKNGGGSSFTPRTDFTRLLNPSLALCFATPIRGTEEFDATNNKDDDADVRSVDNSDTATLNTNGEDTITSTLYFDSKYAHIQESRPPMPLYNQYKIGQSKDEIRTIMASDSHSSVHMAKIQQQNEMQRQQCNTQNESTTMLEEGVQKIFIDDKNHNGSCKSKGGESKPSGRINHSTFRVTSAVTNMNKQSNNNVLSRSKKDTINNGSGDRQYRHHPFDDEMEDTVPDVKAVSSSTDSSRISNVATKLGSS